jgi:Zn-dependent protease with chaperone function
MDFFAAQHRARRKSHWLVLCFVLAVISIIALVYLAVTLWVFYNAPKERVYAFMFWDGMRFCWVALFVGGGIAVVSLYKIWQISCHGGVLIATQLGGQAVPRETNDLAERRLLNVVDEMTVAAGIPAPMVFVLDNETSLNAFAAGLSTRDSVVAVTRGLLTTMNREELQGVIGHEISHIVNGDSRLNLQLIGVLYGICGLCLVGRILLRARGNKAGPVILLGLALYAIGSVGLLCGRMIQAAVSREREYLADASAVQFTRNSSGLIGALGKLHTSGSVIRHPEAAIASHLFFGAGCSTFMFATHPPLAERIHRLGGVLPLRSKKSTALHSSGASAVAAEKRPAILPANLQAAVSLALLDNNGSPATAIAPAEPHFAGIAQAQGLLADLPVTLRQQAQSNAGATGIIGGLLFSHQSEVRHRQEQQLPDAALPIAQELYQWLSSQPEQGAQYRLVWLDIVLPVLREGLEPERKQLLALAAALIRADGHVSLSGFALFSLLHDTLTPPSARRVKRGELRTKRLDLDIACVLALIAYSGHEDPEAAEAAYQAAMTCSPAARSYPFPAKNTLSLSTISRALNHLALTSPPYRKKLLDACATAIRHDGTITPVEKELLRAFAQSLDCPAPLTEMELQVMKTEMPMRAARRWATVPVPSRVSHDSSPRAEKPEPIGVDDHGDRGKRHGGTGEHRR